MKSLIKLLMAGFLVNNSTLADTHKSDKSKIVDVIARYETALNSSNTIGVMQLYSQSPTFMAQHAPAQIGREAVQQAYSHVFNTIDLDIDFAIHHLEVLGNTAWARTSSSGSTTILANNAVVTEGNNELFIFKKENGKWKIFQYLFATNQPR